MAENNTKKTKLLRGSVISDAMDKTVIVNISSVKTHRLYHKKFIVNKKYKAHDEKNQYKAGDVVEISPVRPISKDKHYNVINKVS